MIDEEAWMDINALHRQGHTYAQIGRMVGRDWRTVKRYLTEGAQPLYRRHKDAPSMLDPFRGVVDGWLEKEPNLRATRIHQDLLRDYGFTVGYQIVQRHVRDLEAVRDPVRFGSLSPSTRQSHLFLARFHHGMSATLPAILGTSQIPR